MGSKTGIDAVLDVCAISNLYVSTLAPINLSTLARTTGSGLGGVLAFPNMPNAGLVEAMEIILSSGAYAGTIDALIFAQSPSAGTTTDSAIISIAASDQPYLVDVVQLTSVVAISAAGTLLTAKSQGLPYKLTGGAATIYCVPILRGTLTLAGASDAIFKLRVVA